MCGYGNHKPALLLGLRKYGDYKEQIGLEPTFAEYLKKILEITAELKRVLKKTGSLWLNLGDCYGGSPAGNKSISEANIGYDGVFVRKAKQGQGAKSFINGFDKKNYGGPGQKRQDTTKQGRGRRDGKADKCLMMMPERIAIALCDQQGFILRNKICWAKQILDFKNKRTQGSVMPSSVKSRFNESWEYLFFFTKNNSENIYWRNKITKEVVWKKPLGIKGIENKDWERRVCCEKKDCKRCQGTGLKKLTLWEGYDYWCDLDAVRLPPQSELNFERPRMGQGNQTIYEQKRAPGIIRQKDYPESKYNKFSYAPFSLRVRDAVRKAGQPGYRASEEEIKNYAPADHRGKDDFTSKNYGLKKTLKARMEDTKNKDQKSSRTYNIKKLLSEVRLGIKPNTGMERKRNKTLIDPNARGARQAPEPGEPNAFHPLGKNLPTVFLIGSEPHNFQKEGFSKDTDHFAIFPQALLEIPIKFGCPKNGIICDPFCGSGQTPLMARKLGRNFIGIELSAEYVKLANKRLSQEILFN